MKASLKKRNAEMMIIGSIVFEEMGSNERVTQIE